MMPPYSLPQAQAQFLAPALAEGLIANVLLSLFYDPAPADWSVNLNLLTGGVGE